jgi:DNA-binding CsgD family transcriptional regulator
VAVGLVSPQFVGREEELAAMGAARQEALTGSCVAVLVAGEAGIGKTRFVSEAQHVAVAEGMQVAAGRCVELSQEGMSYAPLVGVLRALTRPLDSAELETLLGQSRRELARLLPELDPATDADGPPPVQSARLFELVLSVLERAAHRRPLMLVMEDLHWADSATLDLVTFLLAELREVPLLLVLTYRSDEMHRSHPLRAVLSRWTRARVVRSLDLAPLTRTQVAEQLAAILHSTPDDSLVERVLQRAEGNPFLSEELLGVIRDGSDPDRLPDSLRALLLARLETTGPPIQALLRAVSVAAGRPTSDALLSVVTGQDPQTLFGSLRAAVEHQLLVVDDTGGFVFRHALTRQAVYDDMLPGERIQSHAAFGVALDVDPELAGSGAPVDAMRAYHWDAARETPKALQAAVRAASSPSTAFAPAESLTHLERALALWPRVPDAQEITGVDLADLFIRAIAVAMAAGAPAKALVLADQAIATLQPDEPVRLAMLLERKATALRDLGRMDERRQLLNQALELLSPSCHRERGIVLAALGGTLLTADSASAMPLLEEAVTELTRANANLELIEPSGSLGTVRIRLGDLEIGMAALDRAWQIAKDTQDGEALIFTQLARSDVFGMLGRHQDAATAAQEALEAAEPRGMLHTARAGLAVCNLVEALIHLGRWSEVDQLLAEHGNRYSAYAGAALQVLRGQLAAARGDVARAADHAARAGEIHNAPYYDTELDAAFIISEVARLAGDTAQAQRIVLDCLRNAQPEWEERYVWPLVWQGFRISADRSSSRIDQAADVEDLSRVARELPTRGPLAQAYRATVEAERADARSQEHQLGWETSLAAWRTLREPVMTAYCLLHIAESRRRQGSRERAAEALREGLRIARELGAQPLADDLLALSRRARLAVTEADVSPLEPAPAKRAEPFALTDREQQVLVLIARGKTNKEIAAALFISPKTAGIHVSHILDKLGVTGRVEAATIAVHQRLVFPSSIGDP